MTFVSVNKIINRIDNNFVDDFVRVKSTKLHGYLIYFFPPISIAMETVTPQPAASRVPRSAHSRQGERDRLRAIVAAIEEEIVLGWLRPRQRLVEEELAARFETKRHVIREAIAELERLGLVERQANKGAAVKVLSQSDVEQIYTIREALETLAAEQLPLPCDLNLIVALTEIQDVHTRAVREHDPRSAFRLPPSAFRANMRFHETLFKACGKR